MKTFKNLMVIAVIILILAAIGKGSDREMLIERSADLELRVNNYFDFSQGDEKAREYFIDLLNSKDLDHEKIDEIEKEFNSYKSNH